MFKRAFSFVLLTGLTLSGSVQAAPEVATAVVKHVVKSHVEAAHPVVADVIGSHETVQVPTPEDIVRAIIVAHIQDNFGPSGDHRPDLVFGSEVALPTFAWIEALMEAVGPYIGQDVIADNTERRVDENNAPMDPVEVRAIEIIRMIRAHMNEGEDNTRRGFEPDIRTQICVTRTLNMAEDMVMACEAANGHLCYKDAAEVVFTEMSECFSGPGR